MVWSVWPRSIVICVSFVFGGGARELGGTRRRLEEEEEEEEEVRVKKLKLDFFLAGRGGEGTGVFGAARSSVTGAGEEEEREEEEDGVGSLFSSVRRRRFGGAVSVLAGLRE